MTNRDDDIRKLHEALDLDDVRDETKTAFSDMLERLERGQSELTEKQRDWVDSALDVPGYVNPISSGRVKKILRHNHKELAPCTATCPCWQPPSLQNRPLKPPGRR